MAEKIPSEKPGNIQIFEDNTPSVSQSNDASTKSKSTPSVSQSNDASTKSKGTSEYKNDDIEGEEAALMHHFYKKTDLLTLAQNFAVIINIEPEKRLPANKIHLRYKASKASSVEPIIVKMKLELKRLHRKDVTFDINKSSQLTEFLKKEEERTDVFFQPDITEHMVTVIGRDSNDVETAIHRMKLFIGAIQKTSSNRSARQVSNSGTQPDDSSAVKMKGIYPDLDNISSEGSNTASFMSRNRKFNGSDSQVTGSDSYKGSSDKYSFKAMLGNGFVLKVYEASITKLDVEVIVNAANDSMMHGGGVARVISEAAGWELDDESRDHVNKNGPVQVKENIVTTSGKLKHYKAVIHAVGPMWHDYKNKIDCLDDLFDCVYNILETCKRKRYKTVGMSAISAGIFAVPKELCADMYVSAAAKFSATLRPEESPRELHIIDIDTSILKLVQESVRRWEENPESINQRVTLPKFLEANPYLAGNTSSSTRHGGHGSGGHRGYRGYGHGAGSQSYDRENDGIHGSANRHRGRSSPSNSEEIKIETVCNVKKIQEEKFTWGGVAQLYVVDKSVTVKIYKGEIDKVHNMDVIVCGINKELKSSGYIAESLKSKGGPAYTDSLNKMIQDHQREKINFSDVLKCDGGRLGTKYVFHAVVDRIVNASDFEVTKYRECVTKIFTKAAGHNTVKKIAVPLIGTGQIQTNKRKLKLCGAALLNGLDDFLEKVKKPNISEVHLINNNTTVCEAITEVFDQAAGCYKNTDVDRSPSGHRSSQRDDGHTGHRGRGGYKKSGASDITEKQNFNAKGYEGQRHSSKREIYHKEKNEGASGGTEDSDSTVYDSDDYVVVQDEDETDQNDQGSTAKQPEPEKEPGNLRIIME